MEQEHMTITDLGNGYFRLVPEKGYHLREKSLSTRYYSEAVTRTPENFEAVPI